MERYKLIRANGTVIDDFTKHEYALDYVYKGYSIRFTITGDWIVGDRYACTGVGEWLTVHVGLLEAFQYIDKLQSVKF